MKHLAASYPPLQIACLRGASSLPFVFADATPSPGASAVLRPRRLPLHLARAVLSILMLWCFVWALARASLTDTYAIYTERAAARRACARPCCSARRRTGTSGSRSSSGWPACYVMLAPTASGFASLAGPRGARLGARLCARRRAGARDGRDRDDRLDGVLVPADAGARRGRAGGARLGRRSPPRDWPWILGVGLAGWAGQHLITEAFRLAPASTVAPFEYMALVWGVGIDWFVWHTLPGRAHARRRRDRRRRRPIPVAPGTPAVRPSARDPGSGCATARGRRRSSRPGRAR